MESSRAGHGWQVMAGTVRWPLRTERLAGAHVFVGRASQPTSLPLLGRLSRPEFPRGMLQAKCVLIAIAITAGVGVWPWKPWKPWMNTYPFEQPKPGLGAAVQEGFPRLSPAAAAAVDRPSPPSPSSVNDDATTGTLVSRQVMDRTAPRAKPDEPRPRDYRKQGKAPRVE
ncbi:hypothetical protein F4780DRAFT_416427 [Xylariomycetidae sp. FL0641]|nr:hypothetical protein F4780DRAFT_416427 [Xylariomycetidae sp. FL0641]